MSTLTLTLQRPQATAASVFSSRAALSSVCYDGDVRSIVVASSVVAVASIACTPCHTVETTPLAVECEQGANFTGELHFDSAATFRSFLSDRCLPTSGSEAVDDVVNSVDFTTEAVVVARGARAGTGRCIEERGTESVDVCEDGLRVVFDDVESGDVNSCGGQWTVAFSLPRSELRTALAD